MEENVSAWRRLGSGPGGLETLVAREVSGGVLTAIVKAVQGYQGDKLVTKSLVTSALAFLPGVKLADLLQESDGGA